GSKESSRGSISGKPCGCGGGAVAAAAGFGAAASPPFLPALRVRDDTGPSVAGVLTAAASEDFVFFFMASRWLEMSDLQRAGLGCFSSASVLPEAEREVDVEAAGGAAAEEEEGCRGG